MLYNDGKSPKWGTWEVSVMRYEDEKLEKISFPLGGIGTGCVGLAGNGALIDWEIFNRPNKRSHNGFSHFAIRVTQNGKSTSKVLQGDCISELSGNGMGCLRKRWQDFRIFERCALRGSFP